LNKNIKREIKIIMVYLTIMNSNKIRRENGFCNFEDIDIINKDILTIVNKINNTNFTILDFNNPIIYNTKVTYINYSNPYGWATYPLFYAYNELMNYISNKFKRGEIKNNFLTKVEEILIEPNSRHRVYAPNIYDKYTAANPVIDNSDMAYETVYNYLSYKYVLNRFGMMYEYNPRIMVFHKDINGYLDTYILTAGFDPYKCIGYFSLAEKFDARDISLPYDKYFSLFRILRYKLGALSPSMSLQYDTNVVLTSLKNSKLKNYQSCLDYVKRKYDFENLSKHADYNNIDTDEESVHIISNAKPGVYQLFTDKYDKKYTFNAFTHVPNVRMDYNYYKDQYNLIQIIEKEERLSKMKNNTTKKKENIIEKK
jgi:hypothetical protein